MQELGSTHGDVICTVQELGSTHGCVLAGRSLALLPGIDHSIPCDDLVTLCRGPFHFCVSVGEDLEGHRVAN